MNSDFLVNFTNSKNSKLKLFGFEINKVIISTESQKILKIAKKYGYQEKYIRNKNLAKKNVRNVSTVLDVIKYEEKNGRIYDYIILLHATSPIRIKKTIDLNLKKFLNSKCKSAVSLSEGIKKTDQITLYDYETRTSNQWYFKELNTVFEEVEDKQGKYLGIKITQNDKTYIARNWRINEQIKNIINLASSCNLKCLWRHGHPLDKYFLNKKENDFLKGSHHIGFSEKHA